MGASSTRCPALKSVTYSPTSTISPGDVAAENVGQVYAGESLAHPQVEMVQGAGAHANQHLVLAGLGSGTSS